MNLILDVSKAIDYGVKSLNNGCGLFRGERCEIVKEAGDMVEVRLYASLEPDKIHIVPKDCIIKSK